MGLPRVRRQQMRAVCMLRLTGSDTAGSHLVLVVVYVSQLVCAPDREGCEARTQAHTSLPADHEELGPVRRWLRIGSSAGNHPFHMH
jgi:hypothetical protein